MKIKNKDGFIGVDIILSIISIIIFTGLIVSLMYNNLLTDLKAKKQAYATIYLTEFLENVAIAKYENVTSENLDLFIPSEAVSNDYSFDVNIEELFKDSEEKEQILKKVTVKISYKVNDRTYEDSMQRMKLKK